MSLAGQTAVITGATSGLGRALAVELAAKGAQVWALGRQRSALEALKTEIRARVVEVDLEDDAQARGLVEQVSGPVDILIHAAGVAELGLVEVAPIADLDAQYRVNVRAPFLITQLFLPRIIGAQGQIVFVNSGVGLTARGGWSQYSITKFGLKALADALREEVKPKGVRVMSVYPGRTATPMQVRVRALEGQPYRAEDYLQPSDVSRMVVEALVLPRTADVIDLNIRPGRL